MRILAASSLIFLAPITAAAEPPWKDLFNGRNLDGWHPVPGGKWEVMDGTILGTSPRSEPRHGLLVTNKRFKNFRVRARFKVSSGAVSYTHLTLPTNREV